MKLALNLIIFLLINSYTSAQMIPTEKLNGPFGGTFRDIKWDSYGNMYAANDGGLFRSNDDGLSWNQVDQGYFSNEVVYKLFNSPTGNLIYQKGDDLFTTTKDGDRTNIGNKRITQTSLFGIDKKGRMYFSDMYKIYTSSDAGKTYNIISESVKYASGFIQLNDNEIAIAHGTSIKYSTDGGDSWGTSIPSYNDPGIGWTLAKDSFNYLYLCTGSEIMKTTDKGKSWTNFNSPVQYPWGIYISSKDEIYVSSQNNFYLSNDNGKTWKETGINDEVLSLSEGKNGDLYAGTFSHLFRKEPNKNNWYEFNNGISKSRINCILYYDHELIVMTNKELYTSNDLGNSWDKLATADYWINRIYEVDSKGRIYSNFNSQLSYSTDKGKSWSFINANFPNDAIDDIEISSKDEIYAASNRGTINYSSDFGKTWGTIWKGTDQYALMSQITLDSEENLYFGYNKQVFKYNSKEKIVEKIGYLENGVRKIKVSPWGTVFILAGDGLYYISGKNQLNKILNWGYALYQYFGFNKSNQIIIYSGTTIAISSDLGKNFQYYYTNTYIHIPISFSYDDNGNYFIGTQENGIYKTSIPTKVVNLPVEKHLYQNYPNPFTSQTYIEFTLTKQEDVKIVVYNILGQELETIVNGNFPVGNFKISWNGNRLANGVYFYRMFTNDFVETKKMILMKQRLMMYE